MVKWEEAPSPIRGNRIDGAVFKEWIAECKLRLEGKGFTMNNKYKAIGNRLWIQCPILMLSNEPVPPRDLWNNHDVALSNRLWICRLAQVSYAN